MSGWQAEWQQILERGPLHRLPWWRRPLARWRLRRAGKAAARMLGVPDRKWFSLSPEEPTR